MQPTSRTATLLAAFALALAAAFIAIPAWHLIVPGPFDWHIKQPEFVQGGIEALVLIGLVGGAFMFASRRWVVLLCALVLELYLRRHAVDVSLLIDLLYLEIIVGVGALMRRLFGVRAPDDAGSYLQTFMLGFIVWGVFAWTASALGVGSIHALRALTFVLGIGALFGRHTPFVLHLWRRMREQGRSDRFWSGALTAWIAVLYARTNVVFGYDSLWYGLRAEYVLDPRNSVFEPLGLVSPVHYFPKLYEVFLLPLSGMGDSSVLAGMTICMFVLVLLACRRIGDQLGLPAQARMPTLALIATLPALAASAVEPKPDVIAALFVLIAAAAAMQFVRTRAVADITWVFACSALACTAKMTAIPYVGLLVLATAWAAWRQRPTTPQHDAPLRGEARLALTAATGALVVVGFVTARTWLLAGMPTIGPDPLFRLWTAFGMHLREPIGTLQWTWPQDWSDVPLLFVDWLFRPERMSHIVISWVGNVWLWFALLAGAAALAGARTQRREHSRWPLAALIVAGLVLAIAIRYRERGSDGNYFLAALLPGLLVAATAAMTRLAQMPRAFAGVLASMSVFVLFQASYDFASTGWTMGTRTFDVTLDRRWNDTRRQRWQFLASAGLEQIGRFLKEQPADARAIGYAAEPASLWLPARFENLLTILYSRSEYLETEPGFESFLRDQRIAYLILPQPDARADFQYMAPAVLAVAQKLQADPAVRRIDDRNYFLLDLSARITKPD
jgi:hypothetical protein